MKTIIVAAIAAASVLLTGCASGAGKAVLDNLQGCERHYNGVVAVGVLQAGSFSGSVKIDCPVHQTVVPIQGPPVDVVIAAPSP